MMHTGVPKWTLILIQPKHLTLVLKLELLQHRKSTAVTNKQPGKAKGEPEETLLDADDSLEEDGKVWISGNDEEHHPAADQNHQRRDHPLEVNVHFGL